MYPFEQQSGLSSKPKVLEDKLIPDTLVSLKIAKKHMETSEIKDRIVKEALEEILIYYAANSRNIGFPEMTIGIQVVLRKFKKNSGNSSYRNLITAFLNVLEENSKVIISKRAQVRDKLKSTSLTKIATQLNHLIGKNAVTPLEAERAKILKRRAEKDQMRETDLLSKK